MRECEEGVGEIGSDEESEWERSRSEESWKREGNGRTRGRERMRDRSSERKYGGRE